MKLKTIHWLSIVGLVVVIALTWNFNRSDSFGAGLWQAYEALAVVAFTAAWMGSLTFAVIWVYSKVERGVVEERLDIQRAGVAREWVKRA